MRLLWELSTPSKTQLKINLKKSTLKYEIDPTIPSNLMITMDDLFIMEEHLEPNSSIKMKFTEQTDEDKNLFFSGEGIIKKYACSMQISCGTIPKLISPASSFSVYIPVKHLKYQNRGDTYRYTYGEQTIWKPETTIAEETKKYQEERKTVKVNPNEKSSISISEHSRYHESTPVRRPHANEYHKQYSDRIQERIKVKLPSPISMIKNNDNLGASCLPEDKTTEEPEDIQFLELLQSCQEMSVHGDIVKSLIDWSYYNRQTRKNTKHVLSEEEILAKADEIKRAEETESHYANLGDLYGDIKLERKQENTMDQQYMSQADIDEEKLRQTLTEVIILKTSIL